MELRESPNQARSISPSVNLLQEKSMAKKGERTTTMEEPLRIPDESDLESVSGKDRKPRPTGSGTVPHTLVDALME